MTLENQNLIEQAKQFAQKLYKDHYRISGENVYFHALRVSERLAKTGVKDEKLTIAAILHLALEIPQDNKAETIQQIEELFGHEVLEVIKAYTELHITKVTHEGSHGLNDKYIVQTYINLVKDLRVLLIRLADKVDNINTAYALPRELGIVVAQKALYVYAPIARLLQLSSIYKILENGAFKILYPDKYYEIEQLLNEKMPKLQEFFAQEIPVIKDLLAENGIKADITYRIKHLYSIYKKAQKYMLKEGADANPKYSEVYDISAMRIVVDSVEDCYEVEDLMNRIWEQQDKFRDDYIKDPKQSGYQSLHNVYQTDKGDFVEVQIRTREMHEFNEFGSASHIFYKIGDKFKKNLKENPNFVKELSDWKKNQEMDESSSQIKHFESKVYAYTPKGDIIEIPAGGCVLDFAYGVHTSVGNGCIGAIVNGQMQKLTHVIKTGDTVEIKTSNTRKKPNRDWLDFVKSEKAKTHIRKELRLN
jgi:GTP pyrophosphokinase